MMIDYPVQLMPLKILASDDSVKFVSPGEPTFAVVSHNKVVAKAETPKQLGIAYREYVSKKPNDTLRVVSYEVPFDELHTQEAIFNVRPIGSNKKDFQIGMFFSLEKLEKRV